MTGRTPGIRQRSKGSYQITVYAHRIDADGKYERIVETIRGTRRDAEQRRAELLTQVATRTYQKPAKELVVDYLRRWLDSEPNFRATTRKRYQWVIDQHIAPHIGSVTLQDFEAIDVQRLMRAWHDAGVSTATVIGHYSVLHRALERAVKMRLVARNVASDVDRPRAERKERDVLDEHGLGTLVAGISGHPQETAFAILIFTGMRLGEVLGLRWRDVDLEHGALRIVQQRTILGISTVKTHRSNRQLDIDRGLVQRLRAHKARQNADRLVAGAAWVDNDLIICDGLGLPLTHSTVDHTFKRLIGKLGLPASLRVHDLRHTHASHLIAAGVDVRTVADRLGHATPGFTLNVYSHALRSRQREAAELFAGQFAPVSDDAATAGS